MRRLIALASMLLLTACAHMFGIGTVSTYQSNFDGSTVVEMSPGHVFDPGAASAPFNLGARWTSQEPGKAWLVVEIPGISTGGAVSIQSNEGLQFNLDGEVIKLSSGQTFTDIESSGSGAMSSQDSSKSFVADLDLVRRIANSDSAKVKVVTGRGYKEAVIREGMGSALGGFKTFLKEVEDAR